MPTSSTAANNMLTHTIIGAAMEVHRTLGPGFLEAIYRKALLHELSLRGLSAQTEIEIHIPYKNFSAGKHRLDLVVEQHVVGELKAVSALADIHTAQALSYLKATGLKVALVMNFGGSTLVWKRLIL
jgi:GxxExxY protein